MKVEKRKITQEKALEYFNGYSLVASLVGAGDFNKKLGKVIKELDEVRKGYGKQIEALSKTLKDQYVEKYELKEFPWYQTDEDYALLDISERMMISKYNIEYKEKQKEILNEEVEVELLLLTESDIKEQEKVGKKYKEQGFTTTPNFYRLLDDIIDSKKPNKEEVE